ncbi:MAG: hypothetical protein HC856_04130 [Pseudanabaena sp. RU_4_16]|nr:hypothetical protein [Pseudanabaena sp. RU_4_16]
MLGNPLKAFIAQVTHKLSLRFILTVPFVIQVASTSFVGYLSYRNGQEAVNNLANQLMGQVSFPTYRF